MRILLALLLCAAIMTGAMPALAATATIVLHPGDNWIAAPLVPLNPAPTEVFAGCAIDGNLTRFDSSTGLPVLYRASDPSAFAGILLGDGYKLRNPTTSDITVTYEGLPDGVPGPDGRMSDMWVSLPGNQSDGLDAGGTTWVGQPFAHDTAVAGMLFTNGDRVLNSYDAVEEGWVDPLWTGFDASTQKTFTAGLSQFHPDETWFRVGHMYEIVTHRDNLAIIIGPTPVPEPNSLTTLALALGTGFALLRRKR